MRALNSLGVVGVVVLGCGTSKPPSVVNVTPSEPSNGSTLVLYEDNAYLSYRTEAFFDESGTARLSNVPVGERTELRLVGGGALSGQHALRVSGYERFKVLDDKQAIAITESATSSGRVVQWDYRGVVLADENGAALVSDRIFAIGIPNPPGSLVPGELVVRGGEQGKREVEIKTWLDSIDWQVAYTIILDGANANRASLQGWLSIESKIAQPMSVEKIAVVGGRSTKLPDPDPWARYRRYRETAIKPAKQLPRVPIALLSRGAKIRGGGSVRLPMFSGAKETSVVLTRVFDPVGTSVSHQGSTPVFRRNYGTVRDRDMIPVALSIQLDLTDAELAQLPAGQVSLFERDNGTVRALGVNSGFGSAPSTERDMISDDETGDGKTNTELGPRAAPGELRIGVAQGLSGRRWQEDFHLDKGQKRIVEELRVELTNKSESDADVVVHEHLYRGLNWSLAYHNGVGDASKAAPQEIHFKVSVPAKSTKLVMYRVVYTW